jgi:UDP-N-acetylglucosamine 2-epimerase (non-hydrolysing)
MTRILFVFGTRPEAIKMAPLITEFKKYPDIFKSIVCLTGQHREMLDQVNSFFDIRGDYDLNLMKHNQTLFDITADGLKGLETILEESKPDIVFVQGDTTTAFIGALAAFYKKIKVAHLEAGLRSFDKYSPYPEEINRKIVSPIADFHFAPTEKAGANLNDEGIHENVFNVGNSVIDALFLGLNIIKNHGETKYYQYFKEIDFNKRIVLITGHRRESFGEPFENICNAIKIVANKYADAQFIYPVHLNPNVRTVVGRILSDISNVLLIDPLDYPSLIWIMKKCCLVLTDSGGIQEEAPSLGKPVLVMREVTERMEGVIAGTAKLVGTDKMKIVESISDLFDNEAHYNQMSNAINPYGDGQTCKRVVKIIHDYFK